MNLQEAIEVLKDAKYIGSDEYASDYDREMNEAIDTVVEEEIVPTQKICQKCGSKLINTEQYGWFCPDIACRIEGQNQHLNNTTYTAEDMEAFAEWISINATPSLLYGYWILNGTGEEVATAQLRELWEQERSIK